MLRWLRTILVALLILVAAVVALVYFKQHALIYHPRPYDPTYTRAMPPGGLEIEYVMPFGKQVAFYAPPRSGPIPRRLWVAFCGNGSLALDWTTILRGYPTATDAFLLIDYPGYGKCEGDATIASTRASTEAALEALARRIGISKDELEPKLCTIGHSLGSAVALDFAARHNVSRAVLIAPFTTLREESARVVGGPLSHLLIENYDNRARLTELTRRNSHARIGIFHGVNDGVIPVQMGRELSGISPQIDFFPIAGADHVIVFDIAHDRIFEWMNR